MSALLDPRQEAFCHAYACGPHAGKIGLAYAAAGYKYDSGNASRLFNHPDVQARIAELEARRGALRHAAVCKAAARLGLDRARIAKELALIAFANPFDAVREDGSLDVTRLAREKGAAVREVNVEFITLPNGSQKIKRLKLALHDKHKALGDLRRIMGGALDDALIADEAADTAPAAEFAARPAQRRLDLAAHEAPGPGEPDDGAAFTQESATPAPAHDDADGDDPDGNRSLGDGSVNDDHASHGRVGGERDGEGGATPPAAPPTLHADVPHEADRGPPSMHSAAPACADDHAHDDARPRGGDLTNGAAATEQLLAELRGGLDHLTHDLACAAIRREFARTPPGPVWLEAALPQR